MLNAFHMWMIDRLQWDKDALTRYLRMIDTPPPAARHTPAAEQQAGQSFLTLLREVTGQEVDTG